jgi:hypothetical protein
VGRPATHLSRRIWHHFYLDAELLLRLNRHHEAVDSVERDTQRVEEESRAVEQPLCRETAARNDL